MALILDGSANTIANLAVGGLPDGIVDTDMIAANAVTASELADNAVDTAAIAANAVTGAKIGALPGGLWKGDGSNQTISNDTDTKLTFFTLAKWTNGGMSWDSTDSRITLPLAGVYGCHVKITSTSSDVNYGHNMHLIFKINGNPAHHTNSEMGWGVAGMKDENEQYKTCVHSQFIEAAANDYIEVWFEHEKGSDVVLNRDYCFLNIQYMGGA